MKLHKREVAQRQLEVGCQLYLDGADILSIHTLAGAAEEILGKLIERSEGTGIYIRMKSAAEKMIDEEIPNKEFSSVFNLSRNQLKHANSSAEDTFDYQKIESTIFLFRALVNYQIYVGLLSPVMEDALTKLRKDHPGLFASAI